jgi:invasion protein IalB
MVLENVVMKLSQALIGLAFGAGVMFATGAASAQSAANPAVPADVKTVGDWHVRCFQTATPIPCSMQEILSRKDSQRPVLVITLAYDPAHKRDVAEIGVPLGVSLAKGLAILADDYASPALRFHRCTQYFCYVETVLPDETVTALKGATKGKIRITMDDDGKTYNVPFSLKGFPGAHDAVVQLATEKGSKSTP